MCYTRTLRIKKGWSFADCLNKIMGRARAIIESSIEKPTRISNTSVLGNAVQIRKGCKLIGTRVNLGLRIPAGMTYIDKYLQSYEDVVKLVGYQ